MSFVLVFLYAILMVLNIVVSFKRKKNILPELLCFLLLTFLMCGHTYSNSGDSTDLFYYERDYNSILSNRSNIQDYSLYYLFWESQKIGKLIGLSYRSWWTIMTVVSLIIIYIVLKTNNCNTNYCLFFFMFFAIALYTGLKYYYGFCLLSLGIKYLLRNKGIKDKLIYLLFVVLAGGFHAMHYFFVLLLLIDSRLFSPKVIFYITIPSFALVLFFFRNLFTSSVFNIVSPILLEHDNSRVVYFQSTTNLGVLIPISLHLVTLLYAFKYKGIVFDENVVALKKNAKRILLINLFIVLLYPLYLFAITFARINTVVAILTLFFSSSNLSSLPSSRQRELFLYGTLVIVVFGFYFYGACGYFDYNFKPMFEPNGFYF